MKQHIGTWEVMVAGVALVVAASTLVTDFSGYFSFGWGFAIALLLGFGINLLLGLSAAELSVAYPRAGALYDYVSAIFSGRKGKFWGTFVGLAFFGMFGFTASGETAAGAFGLQALFQSELDIRYFIVILSVMAVIPNILGIKTTAWVSAGLLLFMLGIRWFFGLAGFMGWGDTGAWSAVNLQTGSAGLLWFGEGGILTAGLALAFWSFVGIEFACSLAEEVKHPQKSLPRGLIFGLVGILATSLVMGIGVTGSAPLSVWQNATEGAAGAHGEAPQLAVGQLMFGDVGYSLMALASVAATLGTLTVAFAAMPRIIYSVARDGNFFGPLSRFFGKLHPKFGTPVAATILTFFLYLLPALYSSAVIDWLYSAAYLWILLYVVFHVLVIINRSFNPNTKKAFRGSWITVAAAVGILTTLVALYFAFAGAHWQYGGRALIVTAGALLVTVVSFRMTDKPEESPIPAVVEAEEPSSIPAFSTAHELDE
ncbi:APC family permease [Aliifodinibius sp. S!AR15-10]|nr:APC family permease [Aliifodinibius sp. S!AR15-10]